MADGPGENAKLVNAIAAKLGADLVVMIVCKGDELIVDVAMMPGTEPLEVIDAVRQTLAGFEKEHG